MGGGLISGWAYKRNKKNVSEQQDKTYLYSEKCIKAYIPLHFELQL